MACQSRPIPKMMCCPSASHKKFHSQMTSHRVMSVGSTAAMPERKNRRKSSPKLTRALGGVDKVEVVGVGGFTSDVVTISRRGFISLGAKDQTRRSVGRR